MIIVSAVCIIPAICLIVFFVIRKHICQRKGVIVADRHIHFSIEEAKEFGVKDREIVSLYIAGEKAGIIDNVLCRVHEQFRLDCHLDTDDAAAFGLSTGDTAELVKEYKIIR